MYLEIVYERWVTCVKQCRQYCYLAFFLVTLKKTKSNEVN